MTWCVAQRALQGTRFVDSGNIWVNFTDSEVCFREVDEEVPCCCSCRWPTTRLTRGVYTDDYLRL